MKAVLIRGFKKGTLNQPLVTNAKELYVAHWLMNQISITVLRLYNLEQHMIRNSGRFYHAYKHYK